MIKTLFVKTERKRYKKYKKVYLFWRFFLLKKKTLNYFLIK